MRRGSRPVGTLGILGLWASVGRSGSLSSAGLVRAAVRVLPSSSLYGEVSTAYNITVYLQILWHVSVKSLRSENVLKLRGAVTAKSALAAVPRV